MAGVRQLLVSSAKLIEPLPRAAFGLHPHSDATSNHTPFSMLDTLVFIDTSMMRTKLIEISIDTTTESKTTKLPKKPATIRSDT